MLQEREFSNKRALGPFLLKIGSYCLRYQRWFLPFFVAVSLVAISDAVFPLLWMNFIDGVITPLLEKSRNGSIADAEARQILYYLGYYVLFMLVQFGGSMVFLYYSGRIREHLMYDLRADMFAKLQHLSFSFYDRSASGWLVSRLTSDTDRVSDLISWGLLSLVWGVVMIFACIVAMLFYSWKLTLVVAASIPLLFLLSVRLRFRVLQYARLARKVNSEMTAALTEHVHGIEVNKVTGQEKRAAAFFGGVTQQMRVASFRAGFSSAMYNPLVVIVGSVATGIIIYLGGNMAVAGVGGITLGILVAFFSYARSIYEPILDITNFYAMAQSCLSAGERIFGLLEEAEEVGDAPGVPDFGEIRGEIVFDDVTFHYKPEQPILQRFNLTIAAGESVALVGATGGGKTTLISLIARFYQPVGGQLLIDGQDYTHRTLHSYRKQLGIILQTPHVFTGTILENIRYSDQQASEAQIRRVLQRIGADELSARLLEAVGEDGSSLSTGEKQLIAFARVLLRDPKILIMDEATSSVDTLAEARVQRGIAELVRGRTSIIIAHRLSTIRNCDRILVVDNGIIVEEGSHRELLDLRGSYYALHAHQVGDMIYE